MTKQIHLAAHFPGVNNTTVWSDPAAGSHIEFDSFRQFAQIAERGRLDFLFLAEGLRLLGVERGDVLGRLHRGELPARRLPGPGRPLRAGPNVPGHRARAVGLLARRRDPGRLRHRTVPGHGGAGDLPSPGRLHRHRRAVQRATVPAGTPGHLPGSCPRPRSCSATPTPRRPRSPATCGGPRSSRCCRSAACSAPTTPVRRCATILASLRCAAPAKPRPPGLSLPAEEEARMTTTPLTALDLVPISPGSSAAQALRNSVDLAQQTERPGYTRYWFAEHHLNPGVAGTSPAVVLGLTAAATSTIRLGSGAVQMGHRTALATVEEFGLLDALHPGRFDLGLGRSGGRPRGSKAPALVGGGAAATVVDGHTPNGLLIPPRFDIRPLLGSPRFALQRRLLQLPNAEPQNYTEQVSDVLALIAGTYRSPEGEEAHVVPGEGAALQIWILGSSGGESAEVAGERGLRFAANYHVSPATVLEAVDGYRAAFRPSAELGQPYVSVSADVVVADTEAKARELATGYGLWVRSIRTAEGAIQFPTPDEARRHVWSDADRGLVADRTATQFAGTPAQVADQLERLRDATEADELIITTITHDHADRVRSYQLLADEWARR